MSMGKWILVIAAVLGVLIGWLIKSGLTVRTGEESAVRPGKPVEIYHEHVASEYLRAKEQIREIQKTRKEQAL